MFETINYSFFDFFLLGIGTTLIFIYSILFSSILKTNLIYFLPVALIGLLWLM